MSCWSLWLTLMPARCGGGGAGRRRAAGWPSAHPELHCRPLPPALPTWRQTHPSPALAVQAEAGRVPGLQAAGSQPRAAAGVHQGRLGGGQRPAAGARCGRQVLPGCWQAAAKPTARVIQQHGRTTQLPVAGPEPPCKHPPPPPLPAAQAKASAGVRPGDVVRASVAPPPPLEAAPEALPLCIVYEDEHLLVVNKVSGAARARVCHAQAIASAGARRSRRCCCRCCGSCRRCDVHRLPPRCHPGRLPTW